VPDTSQYMSNGFSMLGWANTGAVVRSFFNVRNTSSHY
jgi:hypothetical protein